MFRWVYAKVLKNTFKLQTIGMSTSKRISQRFVTSTSRLLGLSGRDLADLARLWGHLLTMKHVLKIGPQRILMINIVETQRYTLRISICDQTIILVQAKRKNHQNQSQNMWIALYYLQKKPNETLSLSLTFLGFSLVFSLSRSFCGLSVSFTRRRHWRCRQRESHTEVEAWESDVRRGNPFLNGAKESGKENEKKTFIFKWKKPKRKVS